MRQTFSYDTHSQTVRLFSDLVNQLNSLVKENFDYYKNSIIDIDNPMHQPMHEICTYDDQVVLRYMFKGRQLEVKCTAHDDYKYALTTNNRKARKLNWSQVEDEVIEWMELQIGVFVGGLLMHKYLMNKGMVLQTPPFMMLDKGIFKLTGHTRGHDLTIEVTDYDEGRILLTKEGKIVYSVNGSDSFANTIPTLLNHLNN